MLEKGRALWYLHPHQAPACGRTQLGGGDIYAPLVHQLHFVKGETEVQRAE